MLALKALAQEQELAEDDRVVEALKTLLCSPHVSGGLKEEAALVLAGSGSSPRPPGMLLNIEILASVRAFSSLNLTTLALLADGLELVETPPGTAMREICEERYITVLAKGKIATPGGRDAIGPGPILSGGGLLVNDLDTVEAVSQGCIVAVMRPSRIKTLCRGEIQLAHMLMREAARFRQESGEVHG